MASGRIEQDIELRPDAGPMILTLASKAGMSVTAAFREFLDNSFDAGAKRVEFEYNSRAKTLVISDNGRGTDTLQAIVTPYKHEMHTTTQSGRYGIGGTVSQIWLTRGRGKSEVESITKMFKSTIIADFGEWTKSGVLHGNFTQEPNTAQITGTAIKLTGCMEINSNHLGSANRELSFCFTPALRKGAEIVITLNDKPIALKAYRRPEYLERLNFDFHVDGCRVHGRCYLVKPGETNMGKGWAIAYGHHFMGVFREPAGSRNVDFGRLYSEVVLPREWKNITDHKNDFVSDPCELWEKLAEVCGPILDRIEQEGTTLELEAASKAAQELLDTATGFAGEGIKGRRGGPHEKNGAIVPEQNGTPHTRFSKYQPGNKNVKSPRRIVFNWCSGMDLPYEVYPERRLIRVSLNKDHPRHQKYHSAQSGEFLADYVLFQVAADYFAREEHYQAMFPNMAADNMPQIFQNMLACLRGERTAVETI